MKLKDLNVFVDKERPVDQMMMDLLHVFDTTKGRFSLESEYRDVIVAHRSGKTQDEENAAALTSQLGDAQQLDWEDSVNAINRFNTFIERFVLSDKNAKTALFDIAYALVMLAHSSRWNRLDPDDGEEIIGPSFPVLQVKDDEATAFFKGKKTAFSWDFSRPWYEMINYRLQIAQTYKDRLRDAAKKYGFTEFATLIEEELGASVFNSLGNDAVYAWNRLLKFYPTYFYKYSEDGKSLLDKGDLSGLREEFVGEGSHKDSSKMINGIYSEYWWETRNVKIQDLCDVFNKYSPLDNELNEPSYKNYAKKINGFYQTLL